MNLTPPGFLFPFFFEYGATTHPRKLSPILLPRPSFRMGRICILGTCGVTCSFFGYASPLGQLRKGRGGGGRVSQVERLRKPEGITQTKTYTHTVVLYNIYFSFFFPGKSFFPSRESGKANKCRYTVCLPPFRDILYTFASHICREDPPFSFSPWRCIASLQRENKQWNGTLHFPDTFADCIFPQ